MVVISFHTLEDRIVKDALRESAKSGLKYFRVLTKKPGNGIGIGKRS